MADDSSDSACMSIDKDLFGLDYGDDGELVEENYGVPRFDLQESIIVGVSIAELIKEQNAISNTKFVQIYLKNQITRMRGLLYTK